MWPGWAERRVIEAWSQRFLQHLIDVRSTQDRVESDPLNARVHGDLSIQRLPQFVVYGEAAPYQILLVRVQEQSVAAPNLDANDVRADDVLPDQRIYLREPGRERPASHHPSACRPRAPSPGANRETVRS